MSIEASPVDRPGFESEGVSEGVRGSIFAFVMGRVRDAHTAEDLTQEILLRAASKRQTVRYKDKLDSWLFRIARNAVADHFRRARPTERFYPQVHRPEESDHEAAGPDEADLKLELAAYIRSVVENLPPLYRGALLLTEYEGISQVELARREGISVSAAKSRVQRARAEVRRVIEECCDFTTDTYGTVLECEPRRKDRCDRC